MIVQDENQVQAWQCGCCKKWIEEEFHCDVCGQWICEDKVCSEICVPPDSVMHTTQPYICSLCTDLPREVQDAAYTLQIALNRR